MSSSTALVLSGGGARGAIFSDKLRSDIDQLRRINRIIEWSQEFCSPDYLQRLNRHILENRNPYLDPSFNTFERFVMRLFALDPREGRELLSYFIFSPKYVRALMDLGYEDARRQHEAGSIVRKSFRDKGALHRFCGS